MSRLTTQLASLAALLMASLTALGAHCQVAPPSVKLVTAQMVSPSAAWTHYGSATTHTTTSQAWSPAAPEIVTLARALGANRLSSTAYTQNVYDYVRNNIATEFRFGLAKGARGALIDQSGTAFDQAQLMVYLLRQGGVSASFQLGTISPSVQQFGQWTGLVTGLNQANQTFTVNGQSACQMLADGAIPAIVNGVSNCTQVSGNLTSVTLGHVWVAANGNLYDPAFKRLKLKAGVAASGIDLSVVALCGAQPGNCTPGSGATMASAVSSALTTGATSSTVSGYPAWQYLNESAINTQLNSYAVNVQAYIKAFLPTAKLDDVIGGSEIDPTYQPAVGTTLPYTSAAQGSPWTGDVPDQFRTTLRVQDAPIDQTFYADEIAGRQVQIVPYTMQLFSDQSAVQTSSSALATTVTLTATRPYAASGNYGVETDTLAYNVGPATYTGPLATGPILILQNWGDVSPSAISYYADFHKAFPSPFSGTVPGTAGCNAYTLTSGAGNIPTSQACRGDSLLLNAAQLAVQQTLLRHSLSAIGNVNITQHDSLGLEFSVYPTNNTLSGSPLPTYLYFSDVGAWSIESTSGDATGVTAAFESLANLSSMVEGSVVQQTADTPMPGDAPAALVQTNRLGGQFIYVPSTGMSTILSSLNTYDGPIPFNSTQGVENYSSAFSAQISSFAGAGFNFIVTKFPSTTTGTSLITLGGGFVGDSPGSLSYLYNLYYKGGGDALAQDPALQARDLAKQSNYSLNQKKYASISAASGDLTLTPPPDIIAGVGPFPASLPFQRYYMSGAGTYETNEMLYHWVSEQPIPGCTPICGEYSNYVTPTYDGADTDVVSRIGGGWTYNYAISARIGNDAMEPLGQTSGLDASALIAAIYTLDQVNRNSGFQARFTGAFISYWLSTGFVDDIITVKNPIRTEVFHLLPSQTFNPPPGSAATITRSADRAYTRLAPPQYGPGGYDYGGIILTYTGQDGSVMTFDSAGNDRSKSNESPFSTNCGDLGGSNFKIDSWTFPQGISVTFGYASVCIGTGNTNTNWKSVPYPAEERARTTYALQTISNSLGRSLSFNPFDYATNTDITGSSWPITSVTDTSVTQNAPAVGYALSNCPTLWSNNGAGQQTPRQFTCNNLTATLPDGSVIKYDYTPGSYSPDPTVITKPSYRLRRWYSPSNQATPFQTVAYDGMYRTANLTDILGHATAYYIGSSSPTDWWKRTDVIDPIGNLSTQWFDEWNDLIQSSDPLGRVTTYAYDGLNRKILVANPLLGCEATAYDVRSNVLSATRYPSVLNGSGSPIGTCTVNGWTVTLPNNPTGGITTSTAYNEGPTIYPCVNGVICNEPASATDALGHVTTYNWNDTTGQMTELLKPADGSGHQPETDLAYSTSYIGTDGHSISLLSSKTDWISKSPNSTVVTSYVYNASNKFVLSTATVDSGGQALVTCFKFDAVGNLISTTDPRAGSCP